MVERLLRIIHKEWSGLHEAAFLLGTFALLSQVLGLVRDRLLAHLFGAGEVLDVYYAAFRTPDLVYASIASFVAVTVLIPFILERIEGNDLGRARQFLNSVFSVFVVAMLFVLVALYVLTPYLANYIVPGFSTVLKGQFVELTRILLWSPILLGLSNLFGSVTQTFRRFTVFALGPVLYNVGIIIGVLFLLPIFGINGLVYGVLLGAAFHMLIQIPVLVRERCVPRFTTSVSWDDVRKLIALSLPRTLALSSTHFVTILLVALASGVDTGAIAVFTLALNLQSIPLSIVGMSYSVAAFPTLARLWGREDREEFLLQVTTAMRHIMFWSFPAIALFIVLRAQIVRTVLGSGAFDWTATRLTAAALALFALSAVAQSLQLLFLRAHYAMGETRVALRNSLIGAVVTIVAALFLREIFRTEALFRYFLESLLRVEDLPGTEVLILPLAYSIGMITSVIYFLIGMQQRFPDLYEKVRRSFLHTFTVSVIMGSAAYHSLQFFGKNLETSTFFGIFFQGVIATFVAIATGIFMLNLMGNREIREIWTSLHHRFWKTKPIATEQEGL